MLFDKSLMKKSKSVKSACGKKKSVKAAVDGGWEVPDHLAHEAYDLAEEYFGTEDINQQIVDALSDTELAENLAFIFRMNDFREWDDYLEENYPEDEDDEDDEDIEESVRAKRKRAVKASKLRRGRNRKAITAAKLTISFDEFKPWSGAIDTWNTLMDYDKIGLLEQIIDDTYYDESAGEAILSETELNDLLWFEPETVYEWVGLYYNDETGEVSDEPFDNDDEDDDIEESVRAKHKRAVKASKQRKTYYAVQYRDMAKAYIHLLGYNTESEAEEAYRTLSELEDQLENGDISEEEYGLIFEDVYTSTADMLFEIDWRSIGKDDVYIPSHNENERWKIINPVAVDLYV